MKRIVSILAMGVLSVIFSGCSTVYYYAEFIQPSIVYVPADIYRVGVLDRSVPPDNAVPIFVGGVPYASLKGVPAITSEKTIDYLTGRVEKIGRYRVVHIDYDKEKPHPDDFGAAPLQMRVVDSLAKAYDLDGIICLAGNEMLIRSEGEVSVAVVNDEMGMPVRVPEFAKESRVTLTLLWRFYDALNPELIDEYRQTYERVFNRVAYSEEEILKTRPEDMRLMDVAGQAAADYYNRISPHWVGAYRPYYRSGSSKLIAIGDQVQSEGDWEKAAVAWKALSQSAGTDAVRYKAMYNMAVASEMLGRPRVAKDWLQQAMDVKSTSKAKRYMRTLNEQILVYEVVNRQLGIKP